MKDKEIEELTKELEKGKDYPYITNEREMAERLVLVGYGNVKQAVKEFAEKLKEKVFRYEEVDGQDICDDVDNLFKELYGE